MKGLVSPLSFLIGLSIVILFIIFMDSLEIPSNTTNFPQERASSFLLNFPRFKYIINNRACENYFHSNVHAVLIITSHAGNIATRQAHRLALPKELLFSIGVHRVFLLAVASEENNSQQYKAIKQQEIFKENITNGDIIQGNFKEAYRNLTYKHIMGLQWVYKFCNMAKYVIKMDDDIVLDIFHLLKTIPDVVDVGNQFLLGYILKGMKPIRDSKNKWFVSQKEYPKAYYPPFLSGWMYVTTPEVVSKIVKSSQHKRMQTMENAYQSFFWIDDVFVTGILSHQGGAKLIDFSKYFAVHPQYLQCCVEAAVIRRAHKSLIEHDYHPCEFIVGPSGGDMELLQMFIQEAKNCWMSGNHCVRSTNSSQMTRTCVVGRGEAYDWVRRPFSKGEAILQTIKL